jgi:hypothetical protein
MSTSFRAFILLAVGAVLLLAACNRSDPRYFEAAESLIPPQSEVIDVTENSKGFSFESGPYFVIYDITDGGLGAGLEEAIAERAQGEGWESIERSEKADGIELRFERDDLEAIVIVWINRDPVEASIDVNRAE